MVAYVMQQSNLTDARKDMADGGRLVQVTYNSIKHTFYRRTNITLRPLGHVTDTV